MKNLEEQLNQANKDVVELFHYFLDYLGIEERGGGPEGLYYTHEKLEGEYLFRNLPQLLKDLKQNE